MHCVAAMSTVCMCVCSKPGTWGCADTYVQAHCVLCAAVGVCQQLCHPNV